MSITFADKKPTLKEFTKQRQIKEPPMTGFLTGFLIVVGSTIGGILAGFFIPFIIAQFDHNPAWSFMTYFTMPVGLLVGFIVGLYLALK